MVGVLSFLPQLADGGGLVTCTFLLTPVASVPKLQLRLLLLIEQVGSELAASTDQEMPLPVGSGSVTVTLLAVPMPLFLTVTVKPIAEPASTVALSAVFSIVRSGHSTETVALAVLLRSLFRIALLFSTAQLADVVGLVTCTFLLPPAATSPKLQERTLFVIEQVGSVFAAS